jgi:homopolymeric O-antigen transport system permease protein
VSETQLRPREAAPARAVPLEPDARVDRVTVIRPSPRWPHLDVSDLWHYRELLGVLVWRDIKVRYKQTFVGVAWAILQPFLTMVVFTLVFGKFARFPSEGLPYPIFVYSGLLPWTYFSASLTLSSTSVVTNRNLVTKVYFPRVMLPLSSLLVPAVDFALAFSVLVGMMFWYSMPLGATALLAPLFLALAAVTSLGIGLFLAALNVRYRDVPYAIPFLIQIWLWLSPVAYSINALPERWQWVLSLNPLTAVINGFRWSLLGTPAPSAGQIALSSGAALAFVLVGLAYFRASEPKFADAI